MPLVQSWEGVEDSGPSRACIRVCDILSKPASGKSTWEAICMSMTLRTQEKELLRLWTGRNIKNIKTYFTAIFHLLTAGASLDTRIASLVFTTMTSRLLIALRGVYSTSFGGLVCPHETVVATILQTRQI